MSDITFVYIAGFLNGAMVAVLWLWGLEWLEARYDDKVQELLDKRGGKQ
jgi:hypothetical protein